MWASLCLPLRRQGLARLVAGHRASYHPPLTQGAHILLGTSSEFQSYFICLYTDYPNAGEPFHTKRDVLRHLLSDHHDFDPDQMTFLDPVKVMDGHPNNEEDNEMEEASSTTQTYIPQAGSRFQKNFPPFSSSPNVPNTKTKTCLWPKPPLLTRLRCLKRLPPPRPLNHGHKAQFCTLHLSTSALHTSYRPPLGLSTLSASSYPQLYSLTVTPFFLIGSPLHQSLI